MGGRAYLLLVGVFLATSQLPVHAAPEVVVGSVPGTFSVTLSGSSSYSVPIKVAPGSAGTQPQIQLNYDSQALGGALGAGWALGGLSAITRGPRNAFVDGATGAVNFDDNDALYLDGQRLIRVRGPTKKCSGADCWTETEYRKVNDDFTEVIQFGEHLDQSYFRARTKGGVTLVFGNPDTSHTPHPGAREVDATIYIHTAIGNVAHVLTFAESAAIDSPGNIIKFHYTSKGVGDYNISEIDYTAHGKIDDQAIIDIEPDKPFFASINFDYEDAPRPMDLYVGGGLIRKDERLTSIVSCVSSDRFIRLDCTKAFSSSPTSVHQVSHYKFEYTDTATSNRFLIGTIHMFGSNDAVEVEPTKFTYSSASPGWQQAQIPFPDGLTLAATEKVAKGYRFVHFAPTPAGGLDLLFSAEINGNKVAYAFENNGPASWGSGGQPWSAASKSIDSSLQYDFSPPVPFVDEDGNDLGVVLEDIDGTGRTAILQNNVVAGQSSRSAYLPAANSFDAHPEYQLPFVVSRDGKVVANYRFAKLTGSIGADLLYDSDGQRGFLKNGGPGNGSTNGWQADNDLVPPIPIDATTHLLDLECTGKPALIGAVQNAGGALEWQVWRFEGTKWEPETDSKFQPSFPASTNPEAVREVKFDTSPSSCVGLIVATAEGAGLHRAMIPSADGWKPIDAKAPPFDLVDAKGNPSKAAVANLKGDGYDGIVANTLMPDGSATAFAFVQDAAGWHDASAQFVPSDALGSIDPKNPVFSFVGPIVGQGGDDIAILNDQRVTAQDAQGRNRQFGKFYTNDGSHFSLQTEFAPPIPFATSDKGKKDLGVRFVDLHGTGLPDAIFSRLDSKGGKSYLVSGAYRNTGHGWVPEPGLCADPDPAKNQPFDTANPNPPMPSKGGLCPPVPFAGADITGNPVQFVDLRGDGYVDLIYSYSDKNGKVVTKIYMNESDEKGGRIWVDGDSDQTKFKKYFLPASIFPLASSGIGDMGVRFAKLDTHRIGVLKSFRDIGPRICGGFLGCWPTPGTLHRGAYIFDGDNWVDVGANYLPPIPFVTQYDSSNPQSIDLFVQIVDVNGSGLPSIVAYYQDPVVVAAPPFNGGWINNVWTNNGTGWVASGITLPQALDAVYRDSKTSVQMIDVNGDGLPDIVMTQANAPGNSKTWLATGAGWDPNPAPNWQIPPDAIADQNGDPGFRLVDTKGDGYSDVLWLRPDKDGKPQRGLALNNGHDWTTRRDDLVPKDISFSDNNGVDQGVRLLSVTGKGLTDIISSFNGRQEVYLNRGRRADVLASATDGYGITTSISYETLLEYDCSDSPTGDDCSRSGSGVQRNPLGWRAYEREAPDVYPKVAPIPTTYVVRQAVVDAADGKPPVAIDYRYGKYQVDANAEQPLGFGWRESLNEFSRVLTRSEMVQDARARPGVAVETTCIADTDVLNSMVAKALTSPDPKDNFPTNLCSAEGQTAFAWGIKTSENDTCWNVVEGDAHGGVNEIQLPETTFCQRSGRNASLSIPIVRQSAIWKSVSTSFELDGQLISRSTDTFSYDSNGGILDRHGNVVWTMSALADGSSIRTINEYSDNASSWFIGRLTKSHVIKKADLINERPDEETKARCSSLEYENETGLLSPPEANCARKTEKRCSHFEYDDKTGLLSLQEANCETRQPVTTQNGRDVYGNVTTKSVSAPAEPDQVTRSEYDPFGRFEVSATDVLGHRSSTEPDPVTGQPTSITDINGLRTTFGYDSYGRLRRQTSATGISTLTDLLAVSALPKYDDVHDLSWGLTATASYAIRSQVGTLPATWALFDAKGRELREVTDGFTADDSKKRFIFKETEFDGLGRVLRTSVPHEAAELNVRWSSKEYDALGRVCAATAINGVRTETLFAGRPEGGGTVTVVVDPKQQVTGASPVGGGAPLLSCGHSFSPAFYHPSGLGQWTSSSVNMRKQMVESADALGNVTFNYDAGGRLQKMVGPAVGHTRATTVNTYDDLGNKISVSDPDLGLWRYEYDPFGRVVRQTDAKGQVSALEYDVAGRPTRRSTQSLSTVLTYDTASHGLGKVASVASSNGYSADYYYDAFGRANGIATQIDQEQYFTITELDPYGRARRITYPSALVVQNIYDAKGFFVGVSNAAMSKQYWTAKDFDVLGRVTDEMFGNGVTTSKSYDPVDERIQEIAANGKHGEKVVDLTLKYDLIGNLKSRSESVDRKSETFSYDDLNRLVVLDSSDNGRSKYEYDAAGRFTFKSGVGRYFYDENPGGIDGPYFKPFHGLVGSDHGRFAKYDLNGNLVSGPEGHFEYTADNQVALVYLDEAKWARFDYGPSGDRFRQFSRVGNDSQETIYAGLFEKVIDYSLFQNYDFLRPSKFSGFGRLTRNRNYLVNPSGVFAAVETDDTYSNTQLFSPDDNPRDRWFGRYSTTETWYLHTDQLGSVLCVTDQDGGVRERFWYDPWGARIRKEDDNPGPSEAQRIAGSWNRGFTGHEHIDEFSLIHMNGRVYSTVLSMFLSVDPVNQQLADTQGGNGYSYARNNPLRYIDPTGFDFWSSTFGGIGDALSDAWNGITHFISEAGKWIGQNWRTIVVIAVVAVVTFVTFGAAAPAAATLGEAILIGAEAGALAGAVGGFVGAALYGGNLDDDLQAAIKGGVIGAFSGAAFAGVGFEFTPSAGQQLTTTSQVEWVAAHGVVGGVRSVAEGGNFWTGFVAAAATKVTSFGPSFDNFGADTARAAIVGGTVARLSGDKFENGALTGAFSYMFNDYLDKTRLAKEDCDCIYPTVSPLDVLVGGAAAGLYALGAYAVDYFAVATEIEATSGLGDLTAAEVEQIQSVVNEAERPLDVVGSAARGARNAASDIDYTTANSNYDYFEGIKQRLPSIDPEHGLLRGTADPTLGPSIRFEPGSRPFFIPGVGP
jgi:RHS repeat-associated protein